jgi:preprotein translocase SecE subunit
MAESNESNGLENATAQTVPVERVRGEGLFTGIRTFFRELWVELKKTNWPSRNELIKFVFVVMVTIIVVAIALGVMDYVARILMDKALGIETPTGLK